MELVPFSQVGGSVLNGATRQVRVPSRDGLSGVAATGGKLHVAVPALSRFLALRIARHPFQLSMKNQIGEPLSIHLPRWFDAVDGD